MMYALEAPYDCCKGAHLGEVHGGVEIMVDERIILWNQSGEEHQWQKRWVCRSVIYVCFRHNDLIGVEQLQQSGGGIALVATALLDEKNRTSTIRYRNEWADTWPVCGALRTVTVHPLIRSNKLKIVWFYEAQWTGQVMWSCDLRNV